MERYDTAKRPYHGFENEVYTLLVGPSRQRLNVSVEVLKQSPSMKAALKNGEIKQDVPHNMQHCNAVAVSTVFAFVRDGELPDMSTERNKPQLTKNTKVLLGIANHIMSYQFALDLDLEAAQNAIVDSICPLLLKMAVDKLVCALNPPQTEKFRHSKMHLLISRQVAFKLRKKAHDRSDIPTQNDLAQLTKTLETWNKDDVVVVLAHLLKPLKESPIEFAMRNPCQFHCHAQTETEKCSAVMREEPSKHIALSQIDAVDGGMVIEDVVHQEEGQNTPSTQEFQHVMVDSVSVKPRVPSDDDEDTASKLQVAVQADDRRLVSLQEQMYVDRAAAIFYADSPDRNSRQVDRRYSACVEHESRENAEKEKDSDAHSWDMGSNHSSVSSSLIPMSPMYGTSAARTPDTADEAMSEVDDDFMTREQDMLNSLSMEAQNSTDDEDQYDSEPFQDDVASGRDTRGYHRGKRPAKAPKIPMMRIDKYGNLR